MVIEILILALAIPSGFLIARLCRDELVQGRKWFKILIIGFLILGIGFFLFGYKVEGFASFFIMITSLISYVKSYDKKWVKAK